ncbi:hypothetical protein EHS25_005107 [Saitozyma podzolica]|uniref:Uncharacterized protein n=1 Tax=Saitozyma podzolica TaxID=1890683 RepID=A0A427Y2J2_9TREE|nr:hypothetical protein EHS25_005107 [Saitozyma podzolica]
MGGGAQYPFPKEVWSPSGQYIAHVSKRPADRDSSVSLATDHHCIRSSAIETQTLMSALPLPRPNPPASLSFASTFSRTGGWWSRPKNWAGNTVFAIAGIALATYGVWSLSARKEQRHIAPWKPIPSARVCSFPPSTHLNALA